MIDFTRAQMGGVDLVYTFRRPRRVGLGAATGLRRAFPVVACGFNASPRCRRGATFVRRRCAASCSLGCRSPAAMVGHRRADGHAIGLAGLGLQDDAPA